MVDLPEKRRNRSPQRQAPSASSPTPPTHQQAQLQPTDLAESEEDQGQGQVLQRPFSSRPDGGVGWIEPDAVLSTFAGTADSSPGMEADALKAQGALFSLIVSLPLRGLSRPCAADIPKAQCNGPFAGKPPPPPALDGTDSTHPPFLPLLALPASLKGRLATCSIMHSLPW